MKRHFSIVKQNSIALALGLLALSMVPVGQTPLAQADDRDLFRQAADAPYLFILFDNTGSMQRRLGGSVPTLLDDDPSSRLFQAKGALDQVLIGTNGVNFGFASFPNQSGHHIINKANNNQSVINRETAANWCDGVEPNHDDDDNTSGDDERFNDTFNWPTTTTPSGLSTGDFVPLDWLDNNVQRIRERMAPNLALGECPDPEDPGYSNCAGYGIERYFEDPVCTTSGDDSDSDARVTCGPANGTHLPLLDPSARPLVAGGNTPLAGALNDFKSWFFDTWEPLASVADPAFASGCREVAVVLVTDGEETCVADSLAVDAARDLFNPPAPPPGSSTRRKIKTYVIGFDVNNPDLDNIAAAGGTTEAFSAANQQQLVDAFNTIVGELQRQSRTFTTAAVPSVIGAAADNIYLTSFSPTDDGVSLWPGRIDAYKKPVPLKNVFGQNVPDRSIKCGADTTESCLAWDAAAKLLEQAPDASEVETNLQIGNGANQRRVYWGADDTTVSGEVPRVREFFKFPGTEELEDQLYGPGGFGFLPWLTDRPTFVANGEGVVKYFLKEKKATVLNPLTRAEEVVDYVMGDIFHSDPMLVGEPKRFDYFAKDLEGQLEPCGTSNDDKGRYPCFVKSQVGRRRVLLAGSNEGALHAFDAGSASRNTDGVIEYDNGTGQELFAFVPRAVMPSIRDMAADGGQQFTVDGPVTVDDVLRDLEVSDTSAPDPAAREWRTVALGGLREGGRSYYALDVTQPDVIGTAGLPTPSTSGPGCSATGACDRVYPEILWEFSDEWDEDDNGAPDLGHSWSKVNTGRVRVDDGVDASGKQKTKDIYVAVFGGGMDRDFKENPIPNPTTGKFEVSGNFLYMVDIETGKLIYKRRIDKRNYFGALTTPASAPSEPAAVDTDQDSYLDTIYIGNTAGFLYKVDISVAVPIEEDATVLDYSRPHPTTGMPGFPETVDRITDARWDPFPIFDTESRSIYNAPSVIFVPELGRYALAFGTGDREDLWSDDLLGGRFFVLVDDGLKPDSGDPTALPLDASDLERFVALNDTAGSSTADLLVSPNPGFRGGYYLELELTERLINKSFGLSGVLFFSTYLPEVVTGSEGTCGSSGTSRLYSIFTSNGAGLRSSGKRFKNVGDFVTQPYVESSGGAGKLEGDGTAAPASDSACSSDELQAIRTSLMSHMPAECKFAQYSLDVMTLQSQSGVECQLQIPVCVISRNWKEF